VYTFDFFNYAGIHRPVVLYARPKQLFIADVIFQTKSVDLEGGKASIKYDVKTSLAAKDLQCTIQFESPNNEGLAQRNTIYLL